MIAMECDYNNVTLRPNVTWCPRKIMESESNMNFRASNTHDFGDESINTLHMVKILTLMEEIVQDYPLGLWNGCVH